MELDRVLAVLRSLAEQDVDYVLVGGVALNLHGIVRATDDLDLFVRADTENVGRLRTALRVVWDDPDIDQITADDLAGEYPVIRYGPPDEDFVIDLMSRPGDVVRLEDLRVMTMTVEGVEIRIATPATLYDMKKSTVRPIDRADAAALREFFGLEDE